MKPRFLILPLVALTVGVRLYAQEDASFAGFQFNRSLPGARSLGMGGAFVAVANDATAAYSNPAGLTVLEAPEVSLEAREWNTSTVYPARGDATAGSAFRRSEFEFATAKNYVTAPAFASFVYTKPAARWAVALYRHELIDFHNQFSSSGVLKTNTPGLTEYFGPLDFATDLEIVNFGASGSFRMTDSLRVGLGLSYYDFHLRSRQIIRKPSFILVSGKQGDDSAIDFSAGVLWQIDPVWSLGAAYRRGPTFAMNECFPFTVQGVDHPCFEGLPKADGPGGFDVVSKFHVPDQISLGVAFQPIDRLTFLGEYDRVKYSALLVGNRLGHFMVGGESLGFRLDDAGEVRVGMEYMVRRPKGESVSLMLGSWYDPDHTITFPSTAQGESIRLRRAYFQPIGANEIHLTAGVEAKIGRYQMNLAFDHSTRIDTLALSTVIRFRG